jgi:hypothetical protein
MPIIKQHSPLLPGEKGLGDEVKRVLNDLTPAFSHPSPPGRGEKILIKAFITVILSILIKT